MKLFVLWLYFSTPWMWGPIPMTPGWASVAVFEEMETCVTALNAAAKYRQILAGYRVNTSRGGLCLRPGQAPYEGPALEEIFDRYKETILHGGG